MRIINHVFCLPAESIAGRYMIGLEISLDHTRVSVQVTTYVRSALESNGQFFAFLVYCSAIMLAIWACP